MANRLRTSYASLASTVITLAVAAAGYAQVPALVRDINLAPSGANPGRAVEFGGFAYFAATEAATGRELWRTDGTEAGTMLFADIAPGCSSSHPDELVVAGGTLFFFAADHTSGKELWKTDGATVEQVIDLMPGDTAGVPDRMLPTRPFMIASGDRVFFKGGIGWRYLYVSDGTALGTLELDGPRELLGLIDVAGEVYYTTSNSLHKTDGTLAGTMSVDNIGRQDLTNDGMAPIGNVLYYRSVDVPRGGSELWRTDGTPGGTTIVKDIAPWPGESEPDLLTVVGSQLFFVADDGVTGRELWMSDGTEAGTELVVNIAPGPASSNPSQLTPVGDTLFFLAQETPFDDELWRTDGTPTWTGKLGQAAGPSNLYALDSTLYFTNFSDELWRSDGTGPGTVLVSNVGRVRTGSLSRLGGSLLFNATELSSGTQPWISDGTDTGTARIASINDAATFGTSLLWLAEYDGALYFSGPGSGLWRSDGSESGTTEVAAVRASGALATDAGLFLLSDLSRELWVSDGTTAGTELLMEFDGRIEDLTSSGNGVYFTATKQATGREVWLSDGTVAGTLLLADINPGTASSTPDYQDRLFITVGSRLVFGADDGTTGLEPWISDGTPSGTVQLADIRPGAGSSLGPGGNLPPGAVLGGEVFFGADDGTPGSELWVTDGTPGGTRLLVDLMLGPIDSGPSDMLTVGNSFFFRVRGESGFYELWNSHGTPETTKRLYNFGDLATLLEFTAVGGNLFFTRSDQELWKSDGTPEGTELFRVVCDSDYRCSSLRNFTAVCGELYFTRFMYDYSSTGVRELWKSDGTTSGTVQVSPSCFDLGNALEVLGDELFFPGDDGVSGEELYKIALGGCARDDSLLRNTDVTTLSPMTPPLATILPMVPARDSYRPIRSGEVDPDPDVLSPMSPYPLVFYSVPNAPTLYLTKAPTGLVRVEY